MLGFIFRKILNKKWMVISLLIGNLLMVAIAAASPMYSEAVMQRTLMQDLNDYQENNNRYPGTIVVKNSYSSYKRINFSHLENTEQLLQEMTQELGIAALTTVTSYSQTGVKAVSDLQIEGEKGEISVQLTTYSDFAEHIEILHGEMYSSEVTDHVIDVVVSEKTYVEQNLMLGQEFTLSQIKDQEDVPYRIRIAGIFTNKDAQDPYWLTSPARWGSIFVMDEGIFRELIANPDNPAKSFNIAWHTVLDHTQMQAQQVDAMLAVLASYQTAFEDAGASLTTYFQATLEAFVPKAQKLNTTVIVLQVPIFVLLAAFIFMVSRQMLEMEQNEISVFKSRGAAKGQIVGLYLLQSVLIAVLGIAGGIPLGVLICKLLGASNAFLEFIQRTALPVTVGAKAWIFALTAAFFSICTMVLPVFKFANVTIVDHKRQKNRKRKRPWWQLVFLDVILLGISLYGLYQYKSQEEYLAQKVLDGASLDPMLYLCSSLFMLGAGLLILRLLPWMIRLVFRLGKRWWSPALYASFLRIMRTNNNQGFLVVFLVLTVAMGIFSTRTARTINANGEERICYSIGADLVVQEKWDDNSQEVSEDTTGLAELTYTEPDFGKYSELDGVVQATKVLVDNSAKVNVDGGKITNLKVMGINTREFGQVAWFKESLLSVHWYEYLNAMSQDTGGIIVSANFRDNYGYKEGDVLTYSNKNGDSVRGVIYGFVEYWSSYSPVTRTKDSDGIYKEMDNYLIVAHLSQLQSAWGILPYQVWIKTKGSSQFLYDYAAESGTAYTIFRDTSAELVALKNDPVFQGTNGILTIGFIIVLLLCATGFLIYWILSIQSRTLQFGIFRAMGMSGREVLSMLVNEQIFISGTSICGGILVGQMASVLYVPLIQIAYSSADRVIPLEIISETGDYLRLGGVIGLMIVSCMVVLGVLISRIKITQALKLGED